jgi:four helix bundle protein
VAAARKIDDLVAWQLAQAFKVEVYRLVNNSPGARADVRFTGQIRDAAASVGMNVAEGFYRFGAAEFRRFLSIALASLGEAVLWIRDGIDRGHFDDVLRTRVQPLEAMPHRHPSTPQEPRT